VSQSEPTPSSNPPAPLSDAEIDRLLREAEALTSEVAAMTGAAGRAPAGAVSIEPGTAADPLAALEAVQANVLNIDDIISASIPDELPPDAYAGAGSRTAWQPGAAAFDGAAGLKAFEAGPRIENDSSEELMPPSGLRVEHGERTGEAGEQDPATKRDSPGGAEPATQPESARQWTDWRGAVRRLAGLPAAGVRVLRRSLRMSVPRWGAWALVAVDWPFRRVSTETKNKIGVIAIITLLMGVVSWTLPVFVTFNSGGQVTETAGDTH
jgi:hypothetical protein